MRRLVECVVLALTLVCATPIDSLAQVRQSGNVTPTHAACWTTAGVIQDCGASTSPYPTTFGVLNGTGSDGICVQSAASTSAGYTRACLGSTTSGGAVLSVSNFGTAPTPGFVFQINGTTTPIPVVSGATVAGDAACFNNTSGTLVDCGTTPGTGALTHTHIFVGNGSNVATDFGTLAVFADAGGLTLAPSSGVPLTITGASGLARGLDLAQTFSGTDTSATRQLNNFQIIDTANLGAHVGNAVNIDYRINGGTFGSRQAFQAGITLNSPSNAANTRHFYAAAQYGAIARSGDNGTNTGAGALGSIIGSNPFCELDSGATNIAECSGLQVTIFTFAGSSVSQRSGVEITDNSGAGGVQGATFDDGIVMGSVASSPGFKIGIAFDCTNFGGCPISTTGAIMKTVGAQTVDTGIDLSSATITTTAFKSPGYNIDGSGNIATYGHLGAADAASPVAQILSVQNVVAGTSNTAGANFTIAGSKGTGTGTGGAILLQTASAGGSGTSQNSLTTRATILGNGNIGIATETNPQQLVVISQNATTGIADYASGAMLAMAAADTSTTTISMAAYANQNIFNARRADGTAASKSAVGAAATFFNFQAATYDGTSFSTTAGIRFDTVNAQTGSDHSSVVRIRAIPTSSTTIADVAIFGAGVQVGAAPTGGDKGAGTINVSTGYYTNNNQGLSKTYNVRAAGGAADCTIIVTGGLATGGTC